MTFDEYSKRKKEISIKAHEDIVSLGKEYIDSIGLSGDVVNIYDGCNMRGKLNVDYNGNISFYPYKKDGTLSLNSRGFPFEVEKYIIPYTEDK